MSLLYGKLFGQFLVERRLLTPSRLDDLLQELRLSNQPLGALALERGFLTPGQVAEVVRCQRITEERFGEVAVRLGYISGEECDELVRRQAGSHLHLGDVLVRDGVLDYAALRDLLMDFHDANMVFAAQAERVLGDFGGSSAQQAAGAFLRLFARGVSGTAKIQTVCTPQDGDAATAPAAVDLGSRFGKRVGLPAASGAGQGLGQDVFVLAMGGNKGETRVFRLVATLQRRLVLSLVYCLLGRQTLNERLIRETLQDFADSVSLAACLGVRREEPGCGPEPSSVCELAQAESGILSGMTRLDLVTSIGECRLFVRDWARDLRRLEPVYQ
ncbi:hypothetical protein dsx2_0692 [Desulfovibrio sp. X2]|uniref:hypothetical protein n=1 Tax=Desulfovibrio sp. X2 TaxID=941449 RepID=UPI0003588A62|nr:hypothetical protein [Desulfovibrio sp. X2]EPR37346.1 hypothetical protein dsx2_0692 [Desulfovibrio sp. X2]